MKEEIKIKLLEILKEVQKGEGAYSRDQLEHANNTIENMKELIEKAIELVENNYPPNNH